MSADNLHPDLQAALDRDGVPLARLAELVGLDKRTVKGYGQGDPETEERRAAYRRLEDVIAGRAMAREIDDGWQLVQLGDGVSRAEVARLADGAFSLAADAGVLALRLRELLSHGVERAPVGCVAETGPATASQREEIVPGGSTPSFTGQTAFGRLAPMNAQTAQVIASDIRRQHHGRMVHHAQRVQSDIGARLSSAARRWGVKESDALRIALEVGLPPADENE